MPRAPRWPAARPAAALAALATCALAACDAAPGAPPLVPAPPALADFALTPGAFTLSGTAPRAEVPLALAVRVTGADAAGVQVRYFVRRQGADTLAAEGALAPSGDRYAADVPLTLPRGATGLYAVTVLAIGADGLVGDRAEGTLRFALADPLGPPVVSNVTAPSTLRRPGTLTVTAAVSDPDGVDNLAAVELRTPSGQSFPLRDDGGLSSGSGDRTARDGVYTVALSVGQGSPLGTYAFAVVARDVEGGASAPAPVEVVVE